jgi:hypothetical protein
MPVALQHELQIMHLQPLVGLLPLFSVVWRSAMFGSEDSTRNEAQ